MVEGERDLDDVASSIALRGPVAGADEESVEPRVEAVRVTQTAEVAPRLHEGILDGVLGEVRVAKDQPRDANRRAIAPCTRTPKAS